MKPGHSKLSSQLTAVFSSSDDVYVDPPAGPSGKRSAHLPKCAHVKKEAVKWALGHARAMNAVFDCSSCFPQVKGSWVLMGETWVFKPA